jgi:hypothetical protein
MPSTLLNGAKLRDASYLVQDPLHLMRHEGTFFAFEDDAAGFQAFAFVSDAFGDIYAI